MKQNLRYIPLLKDVKIRTAIGFFLLVIPITSMSMIFNEGQLEYIALISICAWIISVFFTDKYIHKYPQRYMPYLVISHFKAFCVMVVILVVLGWIVGLNRFSWLARSSGFAIFSLLDAFISFPRKKEEIDGADARKILQTLGGQQPKSEDTIEEMLKEVVFDTHWFNDLDQAGETPETIAFLRAHLPQAPERSGLVRFLTDMPTEKDKMAEDVKVDALFCSTRMNDVNRLNMFLEYISQHLVMGGYFIMKYTPLENVYSEMRKKHGATVYRGAYLFHFFWFRAIRKIPLLDKAYFSRFLRWLDRLHLALAKRRNRALSKAEMWGRLAFWGMDVIVESDGTMLKYIIAQRTGSPPPNRLPSYYPIVALAKVGLDGKVVRMHKVRSMYPFSEFIQKRIFQDQGLTETGKFKNDFRLTEYGKFIRRYWIDELPQFYDWLKGDIKLVGLRATSAHYLSLYPMEFYDLYIQVKPGLISPIFDESITNFEQIVRVEFDYLKSYIQNPIKTDLRCFIRTFTDIFVRGVRSK
jgi:lipopolysaccharide/colanic/teichoic acid biosynthesis glycosyltransferase